MASYNIVCKKKSPHFYENVDIIRLNSPWYSKDSLIDVLKNVDKQKFVDINIKTRTKEKKADHNFIELIDLAGKYNVSWIGISNVEEQDLYDEIKKHVNNNVTKICAKIETQKGCNNILDIIDTFDGIMVDVEDLAFEIGWDKASVEKDKIYKLCDEKSKDHFRLTGVLFEHVKFKKIVYTYGAFDLLHPGHINMLEKARSFGNELIVGIVGDEAIKELKGNDRPVQTLQDRLKIISSLKCVDIAVEQNEYDPVPNMEKYKPDILVKGDDWDHIPGQEWILEHGGKLIKPPYSSNWSTSSTIKKMVC